MKSYKIRISLLITVIFFIVSSCDYDNPLDSNVNLGNIKDFSVTVISDSQLQLSWEKHSSVNSYILNRKGQNDDNFQSLIEISANNNSYIDMGLSTDSVYIYQIYGKAGDNLTSISTGTGQTVFAPIESISLSYNGANGVEVTWIHDYAYETGYKVEFSTGTGDPFTLIKELLADSLKYDHTNLNPLAPLDYYSYRIRAISDYNVSSYIEGVWDGIPLIASIEDLSIQQTKSASLTIAFNQSTLDQYTFTENDFYLLPISDTLLNISQSSSTLIIGANIAGTYPLTIEVRPKSDPTNIFDREKINVNIQPLIDNQVMSENDTLVVNFTAPESLGDVIIPTVSEINSNLQVLMDINNGTMTIIPGNWNGTETITVPLLGLETSTEIQIEFELTVNAVNDPVTLIASIDNFSVSEDAVPEIIDLNDIFDDIDLTNGVTQTLSYIVFSNSNPGLASTGINDGVLTVSYTANDNGSAEITVRANDGNGSMLDEAFVVTVSAEDDSPTVSNAIPDQIVDEDALNTTIDLSSVFTDIDNDVSSITKTVQTNTDSGLVSASISENTLTLDYIADQNGSATITIKGTSNEKTVDDEFLVTVSAVNDPVILTTSIDDLSVSENTVFTIVADLDTIFSDIDRIFINSAKNCK